jgi:hypothetical protein
MSPAALVKLRTTDPWGSVRKFWRRQNLPRLRWSLTRIQPVPYWTACALPTIQRLPAKIFKQDAGRKWGGGGGGGDASDTWGWHYTSTKARHKKNHTYAWALQVAIVRYEKFHLVLFFCIIFHITFVFRLNISSQKKSFVGKYLWERCSGALTLGFKYYCSHIRS